MGIWDDLRTTKRTPLRVDHAFLVTDMVAMPRLCLLEYVGLVTEPGVVRVSARLLGPAW